MRRAIACEIDDANLERRTRIVLRMSGLRFAFVMTILAILSDPVWADDQTSPRSDVRQTVEMLLKQLDSQSLSDRVQAERSLLDLGPESLTYLPPPELTPSISVREAVKRIRVQLERRAARDSALASLVRLSGEMPLAALLKEITAQTRNRVELAEDARKLATQKLSVDYDSRPFWECLDDICQRMKLVSTFDAQLNVLRLGSLSPKSPVELAVQRSGPYRLAIHSAEVRPIVGNKTARLLRISGKVSLEPRLRPLFLHFAAGDLGAVSTDGVKLQPWNPAARYEHPVGDAGREVPLQLDYLVPPGENQSAVNLRGRLSVQLAAGTERVVFDRTSQSAGTARRRGGVTVRLREVAFEPPQGDEIQAQIKVTVSYDAGGPAFESHRTWMFHNAVYMENEAHRRFEFTDYDTLLQANGAVGVDYRWEHLPAPATQYQFVYEAPTLILDLPLDVTLDAVPLKFDAVSAAPRESSK